MKKILPFSFLIVLVALVVPFTPIAQAQGSGTVVASSGDGYYSLLRKCGLTPTAGLVQQMQGINSYRSVQVGQSYTCPAGSARASHPASTWSTPAGSAPQTTPTDSEPNFVPWNKVLYELATDLNGVLSDEHLIPANPLFAGHEKCTYSGESIRFQISTIKSHWGWGEKGDRIEYRYADKVNCDGSTRYVKR